MPSRSSASAGACGPARSQSNRPGSGSFDRPSTAGWSPVRSARRTAPSRATTSAAVAATTDVPEPPLGDQKQTSTETSPRTRNRTRGRREVSSKVWLQPIAVKRFGPTLSYVEAAFFDLDKTVIATSSVIALGGTFYRDGLISKRTIVRGLYAQVVYLLVGADENKMDRMREAMLTLTKGWDQEHVQQLVRETLDDVLSPIIFAEALELIEEHRKAGRKTVIVSSSPVETVQRLGEYLGVDDVIATRARIGHDGRYTGELEFYAYAAHKAEAIREMAVDEGIDLAASYAYSDSITDLP